MQVLIQNILLHSFDVCISIIRLNRCVINKTITEKLVEYGVKLKMNNTNAFMIFQEITVLV